MHSPPEVDDAALDSRLIMRGIKALYLRDEYVSSE